MKSPIVKGAKPIQPLSKVLRYRNAEVVLRFKEDFGVSQKDASELFRETKRWLWLCARQSQMLKNGQEAPRYFPLLSEIHAVDLMWHTFLLFTRDYAKFCDENFGFFIHHSPQTSTEKKLWQKQLKKNSELAKANQTKLLRNAYEFIYDELGEEVLKRWCEEYPNRFRSLASL